MAMWLATREQIGLDFILKSVDILTSNLYCISIYHTCAIISLKYKELILGQNIYT